MVKMLIFFLPDQNFIFSLFFCRRAPQNAGKGMSKCRSLISFFFQVCLVFLFGSVDNGNNDAISSFISSLNLNKC